MLTLAALLLPGAALMAQEEAPAPRFHDFPDSNNVRSYVGFYHTLFSSGTGKMSHQPRLQANTSAYIGAALNYKWFSIYYALNIPRTSVLGGNNKTVRASQLIITHWWNRWGLEGSYQHDRGLVDQDDPGLRLINSVWQWPDYKYVGINAIYLFNPTRFSYRATANFARLQIRSGGSWFIMLTPSYQNFALRKSDLDTSVKDTTLYNLIEKDANHIVLLARVGYSYAFSWGQGRWTCAPFFCIGPGAGVYMDEFHTRQQFFPDLGYQARLTAGYNGDKWYVYLNGFYDMVQEPQKNLGLKTINESASLSVGYRFHSLRRRILHIL
jgi:hypothetical protein